MIGSVLTIVVSGPQATGKTTLAMALGLRDGIPVFSRDPLMQALHRAGRTWSPTSWPSPERPRAALIAAVVEPASSLIRFRSRAQAGDHSGLPRDHGLPRQDSNLQPAG
jgi:hypothetical protein